MNIDLRIDIELLQAAIRTNESQYLLGAFDWGRSPQGHEFWKIVTAKEFITALARVELLKIRDKYLAQEQLAEEYPSLPHAHTAITDLIFSLSLVRDKILAEDSKFLELYSEWENTADDNLAGDAPKDPKAGAVVDLLEDALRNLEDAQELAKRWRR